jgi:hypothetical protein
MPDAFISVPARMNSGMASSGKDWTPAVMRCTAIVSGMPSSQITAIAEAASA